MRTLVVLFLSVLLLAGCGPSRFVKPEASVGTPEVEQPAKKADVGKLIKFSLDLLSIGLVLGGQGSPAHLPSALVDTGLDLGKAVDQIGGKP